MRFHSTALLAFFLSACGFVTLPPTSSGVGDVNTQGAPKGPSSTGLPGPTGSTGSTGTTGSTSNTNTTSVPHPTPASLVCNGNMLFGDEFLGDTLDTNRWNYEVNCNGGGNNEDECYLQDANNVFLDGEGHLVIQVIKENYNNKTYTSGRIDTLGHGELLFGCVEGRLQVPKGVGLWPAFWLLSANNPYGQWPTSGELDIMEILGQNTNELYGTAHFGPPGNAQQLGTIYNGNDFSADYHVFSVIKNPNEITWYVDGAAYYTLNANTPANWGRSAWPFDATNPFYVILNVAMGGNFPETPDPNILSAQMKVDYVRLYDGMN